MQGTHETTHLLNKEFIKHPSSDALPISLSTEDTSLSMHHELMTAPNHVGKLWGSRCGFVLTTMAMVIQAILAFLLWEVVWRNLARNVISAIFYELTLYLIGVLLFIGSLIGKVALVFPYNKNTFERLGLSIYKLIYKRAEWLHDTKEYFDQWSTKDVIFAVPNSVMTIIIAAVFGVGLTNLGVNGIATLLINYQKPFLNELAHLVVTYYFQTPFIVAAMTCNILGFPYIHMNAVSRVKQFCIFLLTNPSYLHLSKDLYRCLLAANLQWKNCTENKNSEEINRFLRELYNHDSQEQINLDINQIALQVLEPPEKQLSAMGGHAPSVNNESLEVNNIHKVDDILIRDIKVVDLIKLGRPNIASIKPEAAFEFILTRTLTILILAVVLRGLFNFFTITEKTMNLLHLSYMSKPAGMLAYISMCSLALDAVFIPTVGLLHYAFFGRRYQANITSWQLRLGLALVTTILIGLGGFPNGYQESQIGGSPFEVGISVFAAWIELFGTYNLLKGFIEQPRIKNNLYAKLINGVQNKIDYKMKEFSDFKPEKIKELGIQYLAPEQAESIQRILPQRHCFIKVQDVMKRFLWSENSNQLLESPLSSESTDNAGSKQMIRI